MDILTVDFEKPVTLQIGEETVEIVAFRTAEPGNIKFGVNAPRTVKVHREEIYQAIKKQAHAEETSE